jgi:hypothetical protein
MAGAQAAQRIQKAEALANWYRARSEADARTVSASDLERILQMDKHPLRDDFQLLAVDELFYFAENAIVERDDGTYVLDVMLLVEEADNYREAGGTRSMLSQLIALRRRRPVSG